MDHRAPTMATAFAALLLLLVPVFISTPTEAVRPYYKHFDDYLTSLSRKMPTPITEEMEELDDRAARKHKNLVFRKMAGNGGHRQNTSCCMLGELAGDKGFHCYVQYYVARIAMRNRNRAHNRKLGFYGRYRAPRYGQRLMKTFEKCVAGHGAVFHKCCHLATLERRDRDTTYVTRMQKSKGNNKRHQFNNNIDMNNNNSNSDTITQQSLPSTIAIDNLERNITTEPTVITIHNNVTSFPNVTSGFNMTANYSMADEIEMEDKELRSLL